MVQTQNYSISVIEFCDLGKHFFTKCSLPKYRFKNNSISCIFMKSKLIRKSILNAFRRNYLTLRQGFTLWI